MVKKNFSLSQMSKRKLAFILPWQEKCAKANVYSYNLQRITFTPTLIKPIKLIKLIKPINSLNPLNPLNSLNLNTILRHRRTSCFHQNYCRCSFVQVVREYIRLRNVAQSEPFQAVSFEAVGVEQKSCRRTVGSHLY